MCPMQQFQKPCVPALNVGWKMSLVSPETLLIQTCMIFKSSYNITTTQHYFTLSIDKI
jgi:hypothetical protein